MSPRPPRLVPLLTHLRERAAELLGSDEFEFAHTKGTTLTVIERGKAGQFKRIGHLIVSVTDGSRLRVRHRYTPAEPAREGELRPLSPARGQAARGEGSSSHRPGVPTMTEATTVHLTTLHQHLTRRAEENFGPGVQVLPQVKPDGSRFDVLDAGQKDQPPRVIGQLTVEISDSGHIHVGAEGAQLALQRDSD